MNTVATSNNFQSRKKFIRNVGLIFLIVIILLTFFSKTINNFLLPTVTCEKPKSGELTTEISATGEVMGLNIEKITASGNWHIDEVRIQVGDEVSKGDILAKFEIKDIELELKKMELDILKQENMLKQYKESTKELDLSSFEYEVEDALKAVNKAETELEETKYLFDNGAESQKNLDMTRENLQDAKQGYIRKEKILHNKKIEFNENKAEFSRTLKEKELELQLIKLEFSDLITNIPKDGLLKASAGGTVKSIGISGGATCSEGQTLFEISVKDSGFSIQWTLNTIKAGVLKSAQKVSFKIKSENEIAFEGKVDKKQYQLKDGVCQFTSYIKNNIIGVQDGQEAEITAFHKSIQYKLIVPNSSVIKQGGKDYVFVLKERDGSLGKEYYVEMKNIKVVEYDDFNTAISGDVASEDYVITYSTKVLEDAMQVKLR